jgi:hypothetical protein
MGYHGKKAEVIYHERTQHLSSNKPSTQILKCP